MTIKQQRAVKGISENISKAKPEPLGKVLQAAGYSKEVSKRPSEVIKAKGIQDALAPILKKHGITVDNALAPIGKALKAQNKKQVGEVVTDNGDDSKSVEYVYEYEDNIPLQIQGSDRARELLGIGKGKVDNPNATPSFSSEELEVLASESDEIELSRAIFRRNKPEQV